MNKKKTAARLYRPKKISTQTKRPSRYQGTRVVQNTKSVGFASSEQYVTAVEQIYLEEINDIERFVKFADTH